ncbi:hypothetical protein EJ08DRAFT_52827 [Tothia fuscella]|uniref:Uncharacterized protein n=1 Tax=Tothia fuscella TaxID=1048955 RepID=A0A9P4NFG4_9PEZI|nr:hypothetical protein EJ08DRAFT_52827 [Tothia fuscella]
MSSTTPNPLSYTIRFKHHKTTVLLHLDPLTPLSTIKSTLLTSLRQTKPNGINNNPLPAKPSQIQFAKLINPSETGEGWEPLTPATSAYFDDDELDGLPDGKGMGKGKGGKGNGRVDVDSGTSIKATGVKDGSVVAFRWSLEEGGGEEDEWEEWDVVLPSFEDNYGVENQGEGGVLARDFDG